MSCSILSIQPPVDYEELRVTGLRKIQAGYKLDGLCYSDGLLYVVEWREVEPGGNKVSLAVYRVSIDSGDITLLDRLELEESGGSFSACPRIERHSRRVFVPCWSSGVTVARLREVRLVVEKTLTCVMYAYSVDAMSPDTVYVCDWESASVLVVDVRDDMIKSTLKTPDTVMGAPQRLAVLGDSFIVSYAERDDSLVVYRHGSPAPIRVIEAAVPAPSGPLPPPSGPKPRVSAVSIDRHLHFMVTGLNRNCVLVSDGSGNLRHTVNVDTAGFTRDCAVIGRQLWVGCSNGDIIIMSSQ